MLQKLNWLGGYENGWLLLASYALTGYLMYFMIYFYTVGYREKRTIRFVCGCN